MRITVAGRSLEKNHSDVDEAISNKISEARKRLGVSWMHPKRGKMRKIMQDAV
jgi:hypothetical protein